MEKVNFKPHHCEDDKMKVFTNWQNKLYYTVKMEAAKSLLEPFVWHTINECPICGEGGFVRHEKEERV